MNIDLEQRHVGGSKFPDNCIRVVNVPGQALHSTGALFHLFEGFAGALSSRYCDDKTTNQSYVMIKTFLVRIKKVDNVEDDTVI